MASTRTTRLDRKQVAVAALDLLNEVGLEKLTLRAIAQRLDVKAPALYWHFKDKQGLLDEMATEIMRRMNEELVEVPSEWDEALTAAMRGLREHLLRYRDGARVYSGTWFTDTSYVAPMEAHLARLVAQGFSVRSAARAWQTAYSYTIGFVIEEQATGAVEPDMDQRAENLDGHPLAAQAGPEMFTEFDRGFEQGLRAVVAGVGATLRTAAR